METIGRSYSNAVKTLRPSRAEMERRHAPYKAIQAEAGKLVTEMLESTGKTARELYDIHCGLRHVNESDLSKACRVVLMGMVRRSR